ncbi:MAG: protein kinase [Deltaproteobacteria bacterium]|nr:protein kinase [Deltaproteobacteria bacterium]
MGSSQLFNKGELFAERYKIERHVGDGGMGDVYLALDLFLNEQPVAIKIIQPDLHKDPLIAHRFMREVQIARGITDRRVVRTYECGEVEGKLYLIMEFADGATLKEILADGPMDWVSGAKVAYDLCIGLSAIHAAGVIHRDLKSSNVILTYDGQTKICDFGIARPNQSELTTGGQIIGSAQYMAPELWSGSDVSFAADLYALGVLLFEIVSGTCPFCSEIPAQLMYHHLSTQPTFSVQTIDTTPSEMRELIVKLLEKDPKRRPSIREVMKGLGEILLKAGIPLPAVSSESITFPSSGSNKINLDIAVDAPPPIFSSATFGTSGAHSSIRTSIIQSMLINEQRRPIKDWKIAIVVWLAIIGYLAFIAYEKRHSEQGAFNPFLQQGKAKEVSPFELLAHFSAETLQLSAGSAVPGISAINASALSLSQADESFRPSLEILELKSGSQLPVLRFDGNNYLAGDGLARKIRSLNAVSVVLIGRMEPSHQLATLWSIEQGNEYSVAHIQQDPHGRVILRAGSSVEGNTDAVAGPIDLTDLSIVTSIIDPAKARLFINGKPTVEYYIKNHIRFYESAFFSVGQSYTNNQKTHFLKGDIAEILIFSGVLPEEQRLDLERELAGRYSIQILSD